MTRVLVMLSCAVSAAACGGAGGRDVVQPRDVPGGTGTPSVGRITDLGDLPAIPARGTLPTTDSDGVFVVGELILVEGADFGRLPTVNIGNRPTAVLARTGNGGIVCRIPPGIATGTVQVEVSHPGGSGARPIETRRYGIVVREGKVFLLNVGADGAVALASTLEIADASGVAYSADSAAAYVIAGKQIVPISMVAAGGPKRTRSVELPFAGTLVRHAARQPVGVVVGGNQMIVIDTRVARSPSVSAPIALAASAGAVAVDPDGQRVGVLIGNDNQLAVYAVGDGSARALSTVSLLPQEKVPLVRDLGFDPSGQELWVVAGDNRGSAIVGARPTRLVIVRLPAGGDAVVARSVEVSAAAAPVAQAVASRESIGAAAAIRSNRRRAAIVLANLNRAVRPGGDADLSALGELGQLARADLDGQLKLLSATRAIYTDVAISHDLRWVASPTVRLTPTGAGEFGFTLVPLETGKETFVQLGDVSKHNLTGPAAVVLAP